ncbi:phospholipase/carboxylesterase|uniref:Phospholipase/carboxylesterase n=1 Tax=Brenneria salicis ATCC 15712 = DSM 30166 TaxID=714314 RepID=A0A366IDS8_9GAMM|nr:esterase [Brenneria salicis]NMN92261.1 phospholipase/carboxylesterase [Brenneria salicis ATCC 15712 = DSM 30166]RBP67598.1 phospholipase/carboxylesterase [Brenneria salicis ATCC 15712 = DSM 30166]RLM32541.1 esterase [Brenneria salicis ATCC 15712 = DSM 30166]
MNQHYLVVQNPTMPKQFFLLFHGVGDTAGGMAPIGRYFAAAFPDALVVSIGGPFSTGYGDGRQWFSVQGVTEENRHARVEPAVPLFVETVRFWQQKSGVDFTHTALIGFSQGSIMSLESLKSAPQLAGQIVAFSGRFAVLPDNVFKDVAVHLIHGEADGVVAVEHARAVAQCFEALGTHFTLDTLPGVGHGINEQMLNHALGYLRQGMTA